MRMSRSRAEQAGNEQTAHGPAAAGRKTPSGGAAVPPPLTADALRAAQRGAGNAAVTAMIARRARTTAAPEQPGTGVHEVLRSAGKPLAAPVRQDMESHFGTDFSDVRLHTGAAAARSARAIGARAYTSGSHVVIGDGGGDRHTLAHELTHVVQQRQGPVSGTDHGDGLKVSDPSDRFEREAEATARRVMSGPASVSSRPVAERTRDAEHAGHVQRDARAAGTGTAVVQRAPVPGIKLLRDHDPAPHDTTPLRDWTTLRDSARQPTAVDVHQILLAYQKLSNGWSSGMGDVAQALANKFGEDNGVPETVVRFGPVVTVEGWPRGTHMLANPLTLRGAAGSDATTGTYGGLGSAVEGHLLNAHLHGPATPENLAPFRKALNSKHSKVVEEPLKKMIYNDRGTFSYEVVVDGDDTDPLPRWIICHVIELDDDGSRMDGGYEQKVMITQNGTVTTLIDNSATTGPAAGGLDFDRVEEEGDGSEVAALWNRLRFPWTKDYGEVVGEVLETAHLAVRAYEAGNPVAEPLAELPRTRVTFTTGTFYNVDEYGEKIASDMGTEMVADPLTLLPPAGQAGFEPEGRAWGGGAIRGHLLNHHLHGPGEPRNLAPMSSKLNQQFEEVAEAHVKRKVLEEGLVLRFVVRMSGADDQFGLEDVPTTLEYEIHEYLRDPRTGRLQTVPALFVKGKLSNRSDEDYDDADRMDLD